jgi:hypothetical protein
MQVLFFTRRSHGNTVFTYLYTWHLQIENVPCGGIKIRVNPLNAELNPICHLLALLEAHHIFHVSRIRVKREGCRGKKK